MRAKIDAAIVTAKCHADVSRHRFNVYGRARNKWQGTLAPYVDAKPARTPRGGGGSREHDPAIRREALAIANDPFRNLAQ